MNAPDRTSAAVTPAGARPMLRLVTDATIGQILGDRLTSAPEELRPVLAGLAKPDKTLAEKGDQLLTSTDAEAAAAAAAARKANRRAVYLRHRPAGYATASYAQLTPKQNPRRLVERWLASDLQNLLLAGPSRTGKSTAAYAIANDAHGQDVWVEAWTAHDLYHALRKGDDQAYGVKTRVTECDLLLVDDLGRERVTDVWLAILHQLLQDRFTSGRRQILTANAPINPTEAYNTLVNVYGDPIIERILDGGGMIIFDGPRFRKFATEW